MAKINRRLFVLFAACALPCAMASAQTGPWPTRPVRFIVPFATGGPTDLIARVIAQKLSMDLGVAFVVENRSGASGVLGTEAAMKSPADGYTVLIGSPGTMAINPALIKNLPYDPANDFVALSHVASFPQLLAVHTSIPAKNVRELIALAKASPGGILYASSGVGSTSHLMGEYFAQQAGIKLTHVPYRGGSLPVQALLSGEVMMTFDGLPAFAGHLKSGRIRVLGVTTAKRSPNLPDIPTIAESGVPGFNLFSWILLVTPKGVPADVADRISAEVAKVLAAPEMRTRFGEVGAEPVGTNVAGATQFLRTELAKWKRIVEVSGAKVD